MGSDIIAPSHGPSGGVAALGPFCLRCYQPWPCDYEGFRAEHARLVLAEAVAEALEAEGRALDARPTLNEIVGRLPAWETWQRTVALARMATAEARMAWRAARAGSGG